MLNVYFYDVTFLPEMLIALPIPVNMKRHMSCL